MSGSGSGNVTMTNEQLRELIGSRDAGPTSDPFSKLKSPTEALGKALGGLYDWVQGGEKVFQSLSNTGNAFNNDIVGMRIAAANSRMSFEEFAAVQSKSAKDFAGLGGSVAKGGMAFTEFSKTFFDSGLTENLRQMGYTSKDLNEVLASQIGFQKSTTDTSVAGQIRTSQAAAELATEMDLIAKQTGKTRKEQEAALEKAKADGQIEAKMRLIGLTQGAEAEKVAREGFAKQLAQAEAMGTGQVFKEMFATGTVRSQEAAMQMGLLGQAARETANSAKALGRGNMEASQAAMESAKVGNMANQRNTALLNITASGVGPAAEVMKKNIETNDAAYHGAAKTAKAMGVAMEDVTKVLGAQKKAIQDEQAARHGATAALISTTARLQDIKAAGANVIARPLNTGASNQAGLDIYGRTNQGVGARDTAAQTAREYQQAAVNNARQGGPTAAGTRVNTEQGFQDIGGNTAVQAVDKVAGGAVQGITKGVEKVAQFGADVLNVRQFNAQTRDEGTLGKTGQPFEPADFIGKVQKGEMVLTPEQAQRFMSGAKMDGMANAVQEMSKSMPKLDMNTMPKNLKIDTSSISGMFGNMFSGANQRNQVDDKATVPSRGKDAEYTHEEARIEAARLNTLSLEKFNRDADIAMGKTPKAPAAPAMPKMPAAFDRAGFKMPSFDQISIGPDGMPKITAKPQAQTVPTAVDKKAAAATATAKQAEPKQAAPKTAETTTQPATTGQKVATLDDVAKLLTSLNTTMSKLSEAAIETNRIAATQVRATKAMSGNVHDRT